MKETLKLDTGTAIDTILKVAKKLDLKVKYESTGVKDSELGHEKHMWLEDSEGNTKGSYFYWKKNNIINNAEGLTYTHIDSKTANITIKAVSDEKEIYKKFKVRMPKVKVKKTIMNRPKVDRWNQIYEKYLEVCATLYLDIDWEDEEGSFAQKELESPGFIERFKNFTDNGGVVEYWHRIERELFQLENWEPEDLEGALFRVMDDYVYDGIGGLGDVGDVAFTLSYYFTPILKVWFRWSNERIDLFWDLLGEH